MYKLAYVLTLLLAAALPVSAKTVVVTSTTDLAYLAREIGGEHVEVQSIATPTADIHFVETRPSYMRKVAKADLVLKVGLELDVWMDRIVDGSRNSHLTVVDCSEYVKPLEVPSFKADARYGDLHRFGNPHFWLGPQNVPPITDAIVEGLCSVDPANAEYYRANQSRFLADFEAVLEEIRAKSTQLKGVEIVTYHNSWPYFNEFTGLVNAGFIEPYPGVPPSPSQIAEITKLIKSRKIRVIGVEPFFDRRVPDKIAAATGAKVVTLYPSVGGRSDDETYLEWLQGNIDALIGALQ